MKPRVPALLFLALAVRWEALHRQLATQALARLFVGPGVPVAHFLLALFGVAGRAEQLQVLGYVGATIHARYDVVEGEALSGAAVGVALRQPGPSGAAPGGLHAGHASAETIT